MALRWTTAVVVALAVGAATAACGDSAPGGAVPLDATTLDAVEGDAAGGDASGPDVRDGDAPEPDVRDDDAPEPDVRDQGDASEPDVRDDADGAVTGPVVTIIVEGSLDDHAPADGLASQTPKPYRYGLQRLELLSAADDPDPFVVFDYAPDFTLVDMHAQTEVARVPVAGLPEGSYPWFRLVLTHLEADVEATLHDVPVVGTVPTTLSVVHALSDLDSGDLQLNQGEARVSGVVYGQPFSVSADWGTPYPEPAPGAWAEAVGGKTLVTYALSPALTPSPNTPTDVTYVVKMAIAGAFRWEDQTQTGWSEGVWDVDVGQPPTWEPVHRLGANAYWVQMTTEPLP